MSLTQPGPRSIRTEIRIGSARYMVIDLTEPLDLAVEVYPGDPKPQKEVFSDIEKSGYQHHIYKLGDHNFHPHGDAPSHQNPDLKELGFECFDISYCFNRACLIDLSSAEGAVTTEGIRFITRIERKHIEPFADRLESVGAVVIRAGYDRWLESNRPHSPEFIPYLTEDASRFISSFEGVKVVGIDSITIDPPGGHASHRALREKMIVESLVHLYEIPTNDRPAFDLQTTPVRIVGATGGPVVAYAFVEL